MRNKTKMILYEVGILIAGLIFLFVLTGCEEAFGLRFAPSEAMRQNAELTHGLARKVNTAGLEPRAEAGEQLVKGTAVSLSYTGRARTPVDPDAFDTINEKAQEDSLQRPDIGGIMDSALEIGLMVATLIGGGVGVSAAKNLRRMHSKAKGFNEIVGQVGILKTELAKSTFTAAFTGQTPTTRKLVAEATVDNKVKKGG